jgi:RasGEF domain
MFSTVLSSFQSCQLRKARREAVKLQRGVVDIKKLLPKKLNFLDLNISEVAEQLTVIESEMFRRIQSHEFLKLSWRSKGRLVVAPGVVAMVERFNMVSFWVASEIVFQKEQKARTAILKKFINLAEKCLELNNFNTVMEILGGMNNVAVQRLKRTWAVRTATVYMSVWGVKCHVGWPLCVYLHVCVCVCVCVCA